MRLTIITAAIAAMLVGCASAQAQNGRDADRTPLLTVSGSSTVTAKPDRVDVTIGVQTQEETAEQAQSELAKRINDVLDKMDALRLEGAELTTTGASLHAVYQQRPRNVDQNWQPKVVGYRASNTVRVKFSDLERVGEVLDEAVTSGANQINGINFYLADNSPLLLEALEAAVGEARAKAEAMARGLGVELGAVRSVSESGGVTPYQPVMAGQAMRMMDAVEAAPTRVEAGSVEVRGSVTVVFEIAQ